MPTFLLTGATGFIGGHLVKKLISRGHQLVCLVRNRNVTRELGQAGVRTVRGDITSRDSLRQAMKNVDGVFHLAALYEIGSRNTERMYQINVTGSKNVFEMAGELKIPRVIYCSTVAALGNTRDTLADENWPHDGQFQSEYCRTKHLAHLEARRQIEQGVPITIVMPSVVYGPKDPSALAESRRRYCQGKIPFLLGAETKFTYVHVEDVAEGMVLAYERGRVGESYILAGDVMTNREIVQLLGRLVNRPMPQRELPYRAAKFIALFDEAFSALRGKTPLVSREAIKMMENCNWAVTAEKARRELGWQPRPVEIGMREEMIQPQRHKEHKEI
jgi:nucleoside-diphosphate-sugar epimerase